MNCIYCNGTGKYKKPNNIEAFEDFVDREMDKAYHVNRMMAEKQAYKKFGYTIVDCPYCQKEKI